MKVSISRKELLPQQLVIQTPFTDLQNQLFTVSLNIIYQKPGPKSRLIQCWGKLMNLLLKTFDGFQNKSAITLLLLRIIKKAKTINFMVMQIQKAPSDLEGAKVYWK